LQWIVGFRTEAVIFYATGASPGGGGSVRDVFAKQKQSGNNMPTIA
jgi:hypothetical protein